VQTPRKRLTFPLFPLALAALAHRVVPLSSSASVVVAHAASLLTGYPAARIHVVELVIVLFSSKGEGGLEDAEVKSAFSGGWDLYTYLY